MEQLIGFATTIAAVVIPLLLKWLLSEKKTLKNLLDNQEKMQLGIKRSELLHLIYHEPKNIDAIYHVYDEYHQLGGNSYIDSIFHTWEKKYVTNILKQKI